MKTQENGYKITQYRKYTKMSSIGFLAAYGIWISTLFTKNNIDQFIAFGAVCLLYFIKKVIPATIIKTQEYNRFKEIYTNIINKYVELNKKLKLTKPLEIYSLFVYALNNNILSCNESKNYNNLKALDTLLIKELTLNDHGVCRHISSVLVDIYTKMEIPASLEICLRPTFIQEIEELTDEDKIRIENMMKEMLKNMSIEVNDQEVDFSEAEMGSPIKWVTKQVPFDKDELKLGNHAITVVNDQEYSYYLDATAKTAYQQTDNESELIDTDGIIVDLRPTSTVRMNSIYDMTPIEKQKIASLDSITKELIEIEDVVYDNIDKIKEFKKQITPELEEAENIYKLLLK